MLDEKSIDVIARFKSALLVQSQKPAARKTLTRCNRGKKLPSDDTDSQALTPKIVEYDGSHHLVLTNDVIERTNYHNKRRWKDFYRSQTPREKSSLSDADLTSGGTNRSSDEEGESSDEDIYEDNPLKRLRLSEILAPLTHPSELHTHPAISKTYKSGSLSTLAGEIIETIEVEQNTLNQYNKLLQVLDGEDWFYQLEENMELPPYDHGLDGTQQTDSDSDPKQGVEAALKNDTEPTEESVDAAAVDVEESKEFENKRITRAAVQPETPSSEVTDPFFALPRSLAIFEQQQAKQREEVEDESDELGTIQQELISYLQVSIQRQHEYIKNLTTIRNGLVKADRYKKDLLRWGKDMGEKKH